MRYAVISDIHANLEALTSVLTYLKSENITRIYCLGDVVGYGPRPNECVDVVRQSCRVCLAGNHDYAALGWTDIEYFNPYAREAVAWTQRQLSRSSKAFLKKLPLTHELSQDVLLVHSSPIEPREWNYILSEEEARVNLDAVPQRLIFIGHSHVPVVFSYHQGIIFSEQITLDLEEDQYIVNVGSVGQPRDGDPRACCVIYDEETFSLRYVRIPYDVEKTKQEILDRNLPRVLAMRLLVGQ